MDTINANVFGGDHGNLEPSILRDFTDHVTEYSRRTLMYETDSLNAFRGLLARTPLFSHYGIQAFMILDWEGDVAHRAGNLQLHRDEAQKILSCRKCIRLG